MRIGREAGKLVFGLLPPLGTSPYIALMSDLLDRTAAALAGRYTVESLLGAGGMASVFLARDEKHQRRVAVKVIRPELAAVLGHDRFLREVTTTANLRHPHILPYSTPGKPSHRPSRCGSSTDTRSPGRNSAKV